MDAPNLVGETSRLLDYADPLSGVHKQAHMDLVRWTDELAAGVWPGDWRQTDAPSGGRRKRPVVSSALPPAISGDMPWATKAGGVGVVLAGGAVASMVAPGTKPGDYDLWLVVPSQGRTEDQRLDEARRLVLTVLQRLEEDGTYSEGQSLAARAVFHSNVVDFTLLRSTIEIGDGFDGHPCESSVEEFKAQIILRLYDSPAQVIHGFDIDACQVLYNGNQVWASRDARHTGAMLVQPAHHSPSSVGRLAKYSQRYGLSILVLGLDPILKQASANFMADAEETLLKQLLEQLTAEMMGLSRTSAEVQSSFQTEIDRCAPLLFVRNEDGLARLLGMVHMAERAGSARTDRAGTMRELACDVLVVPQGSQPYPFPPSFGWAAEAYNLHPGLHEDYQYMYTRLRDYADPRHDIQKDPHAGLTRWSDALAADIWPAHSLPNIPECMYLRSLSRGPVTCLPHTARDWRRIPAEASDGKASLPALPSALSGD
ncbi:MAG: hypothetical protein WDW38_010139 [Sanguina aurantia]